MDRKTKMRVFMKLLAAGYGSDEAIRNFGLTDMKKSGITLQEVEVVTGLQEAIKSRRIISYFSDDEDGQEGDEKAAKPDKGTAAVPQKEVIAKDENVIAKEKSVTAEVKTNTGTDKERINTVPGSKHILP